MDSDNGEVRVGVISHQIGPEAAAIRQRHLDRTSLMHDVTVRQNEAIRCENKPRAAAAHLLRTPWIGGLRPPQLVANIDIDHRWADLLGRTDDGTRIGVKELVIIRRTSRLRGLRLYGLTVVVGEQS